MSYYMIVAVTAVVTFVLTLIACGVFGNQDALTNKLKSDLTLLRAKYNMMMERLEIAENGWETHKEMGRRQEEMCQERVNKAIQASAETIENLRLALDKANRPFVRKSLVKISFNALLPSGSMQQTTFVLGLGPCGKTVCGLEWFHSDKADGWVLRQEHTDGSYKTFTYSAKDIVGRVQQCFEDIETIPGTKQHEDERRLRATRARHERDSRWMR